MLVTNPDLHADDIITHLYGRIRNKQLGAAINAHPDDFPAQALTPSFLCAAAAEPANDEEPVKRPPIPNEKAGRSLVDFGQLNGMGIVTLGPDGKYTLTGDSTITPKAWRAMARFQNASVCRLREEQAANGGAAGTGGAAEP